MLERHPPTDTLRDTSVVSHILLFTRVLVYRKRDTNTEGMGRKKCVLKILGSFHFLGYKCFKSSATQKPGHFPARKKGKCSGQTRIVVAPRGSLIPFQFTQIPLLPFNAQKIHIIFPKHQKGHKGCAVCGRREATAVACRQKLNRRYL